MTHEEFTSSPADKLDARAISSAALAHLFIQADTQSNSAARVAAGLLLGLYNGQRFPFDLTELRRLDGENLPRALALIKMDARGQMGMEVHDWLNHLYGRTDFGERFEHLAHKWKLKGKCMKANLLAVEAVRFRGFEAGEVGRARSSRFALTCD